MEDSPLEQRRRNSLIPPTKMAEETYISVLMVEVHPAAEKRGLIARWLGEVRCSKVFQKHITGKGVDHAENDRFDR
ncbi:hypothetical protein [Candidatus Aalborgicola defluviihabitans]|uniref:hypothetical protein n=1 Tax=Candidatus Aalborgicola defluviihabitans TaxID=3386187 RepID=UPI001D599DF7|nr:hypothetical protein [Burkholderiales bacterium]